MKSTFERVVFGFSILLLTLLSFAPQKSLALCQPGEGLEGDPYFDTIGSVSLSGDQNTLSISGARWWPGHGCSSGNINVQGNTYGYVQGTALQSAHQVINTTGWPTSAYTYNGSINVSTLPNGTYTLVLNVTSAWQDEGPPAGDGMDEVSTTFTITNRGSGGGTTYALTVSKAGTGTGTVTSSPSGIGCGVDCSESYTSGTSVSLTATPAGGSTFAGWSGSADCSNDAGGAMANPTSVSMNAAKNCTATFNVNPTIPSCSASPSSVVIGQNTTITASGGSGGTSPYYTWSTGSGGGSCATGGTCTTSYSTVGAKTITVTRNGVQGTCSVTAIQSDTPPTGAFTSTANCTATGWADDIDTTTARPVRIYSDGNLVSTVTAGTTGCSGTACTFSSNLTGLISSGVSHAITGTVQGNDNVWYALSNPMSMTCPASTVSCTGPSGGQTGTSYTFSGVGGSSYTWAVSPTTGISPAGSAGSGASVSKSFSTAGTKTITFTSGGQSGACTIDITTTPPALLFSMLVNNSAGPITVAYGSLPTLTWSSAGADRVDNFGSVPTDEAWNGTQPTDLSGSVQISPLVSTVYSGRGVRYSPVGSVSDSVSVKVQPVCSPAGQTVIVNEATSPITAVGGNGTYAWTATGGSPASGSGASFSTTYSTTGTKTVTLTSDGLSTNCTVTVSDVPVTTGTVIVNSNIPTTWTLSGGGGKPQTETEEQTTETYEDQDEGTYTLSNVPDIEGYLSPTISPASSQDLTGGGTITFTINYESEEDPPGGDGVDLKINNSDNPAPVTNGSVVDLSWTSNGISTGSCVASDGIAPWGGSVADQGSDTSGVLSDDTTFTITCDAEEKGADPLTDSVSILVTDPQCSDGNDNDGDTYIDFIGDDPGCDDAQDNNEDDSDDDPTGDVTECSDGFDNDGDGGIDFQTDRESNGDIHCSSPLDDSERGSPDIREI